MPSHFSTIGLPVKQQEELLELADKMGPTSETIEVDNGFYYHWRDPSGAAVWLQANEQNELIGMTPHFEGLAEVKMGITELIYRPNGTSLDGAVHGWANPIDDNPISGIYPFVVDLPNAQKYKNLTCPSIVIAQIAAFAHEITLYETVSSYEDKGSSSKPKFASQSFIPSGLFSPDGNDPEPPQATAIMTGHIIECKEKVNTLTESIFIWCLVDTLGGIFDVVIDPSLVPDEPKVGGVLSGSFWLSGILKL